MSVKDICKDLNILGTISSEASVDDVSIAVDLKDTLQANIKICVGMAANMIGINKAIICFTDEKKNLITMYNPKIIKKEGPYKASEGCLSLYGLRETTRYKKIKVAYLNEKLQPRINTYTDFVAEIIQHEIDHINGIII